MSTVGYGRVKEVFFAVHALPPAEQAAALEKECAGDHKLRREVESLLAHHKDQSILVRQSVQLGEPRVAQLTFGSNSSARWNEEQRKFLHQRLRVLVLVLHLIVLLVLFRVVTYLDSWSRLVTVSRIGMLCGCAGLVILSIFTLSLRAPTFAWLRRLDLALLGWAALVICSWGYGWLSAGVSVERLASPELDQGLASGYWVISANRTTHFQVGPTLISFPVANYISLLVSLYGIVLPNTVRRILFIILVMLLVTAATILAAAAANPYLRPYMISTISSCCLLVGISAGICAYIGLKFQALRRAVFDAQQVGQYQLTRLLGKGAMGEVYLGQHRLLRRPCAVKLIRAEQAGSEEALRRFEREVQAMAQLTHPNTVEIYDFGRTDDDSFFYAMEYLPGTTLDVLVRKHGPLPAGRVVYLLGQVCSALAEAHQKGLVHRDIKPGNIFVCERGGAYDVIKLLDFGLVYVKDPAAPQSDGAPPAAPPAPDEKTARRPVELPPAADLTHAGQLLGTPAYMAPEQIEEKQPDPRSDIYSLGGVACFLLSGRSPFERETLAEVYAAHLHAPVPDLRAQLPDIPSDLERVIKLCLAKAPAARYQDVEAVAAALGATTCSGEWSHAQAKAWWQAHAMPGELPGRRAVTW